MSLLHTGYVELWTNGPVVSEGEYRELEAAEMWKEDVATYGLAALCRPVPAFPIGPPQARYSAGQRIVDRLPDPHQGVILDVRLEATYDLPEYLVQLDDWTGPNAAGVVWTVKHRPYWSSGFNLSPAPVPVLGQ